VLGPEAFDAVPFLNLLAEYGWHHGIVELGGTRWPSPQRLGSDTASDAERPVVRPPQLRNFRYERHPAPKLGA
jgi:hypothetical protein